MSERKATPDVLADLFNATAGGESSAAPSPSKPAKPRTRAKPVVTSAAPAPASPQPAPAPQWEYREVIFREFRGWRPRYVDGRERWDWKDAPTILDYLRQVGAEGWELVSVGEVHNFQKTAYFKRPKQG